MESIKKKIARAADTAHSNKHNVYCRTSFWMCKVRCWRRSFGNKIPVSLSACLTASLTIQVDVIKMTPGPGLLRPTLGIRSTKSSQ